MFTQKRSEVQESPTHTKIQQTSGIFRFSASRGSITPKSESFCICRLGENHESLGGPRELSGVSMTSITTAFWAYGMTVIRRSGAHEGTHHMFPLPPKPRVFGVSLGVLVERRITSSLLEKETVIWNTKFFYKHPESNNFVCTSKRVKHTIVVIFFWGFLPPSLPWVSHKLVSDPLWGDMYVYIKIAILTLFNTNLRRSSSRCHLPMLPRAFKTWQLFPLK